MDRMDALVKAHRARAVAERIVAVGFDDETRRLLAELAVDDAAFRSELFARLQVMAQELER